MWIVKNFGLDVESVEALQNAARKLGKSQSAIVREAIKEYAEKHLFGGEE
jgi:predicted DNA-binding protein